LTMASSPPAAMDVWASALLAARTGLLAFGLLVAALVGAASSDDPAVASLLKTLDLRGYTSRTVPPQVSGSTFDARQLSMTEHRGTIVDLNFWASWCLEYRSETGILERPQREFLSQGLDHRSQCP
jgi:hypothetical protein